MEREGLALGNTLEGASEIVGTATMFEDLIEEFVQTIARKIEKIAGTQQRLLNIEDAAKYLGMTVHALRHKAGTEIPCVNIDSKSRFDKRDLDRYIDRAKRKGV